MNLNGSPLISPPNTSSPSFLPVQAFEYLSIVNTLSWLQMVSSSFTLLPLDTVLNTGRTPYTK